MSDAPRPTAKAESAPNNRRIFGIGALILAVPVVLWIGAATYVAQSLKYPAFLSEENGDDVFGAHVPTRSGQPYAEMRALGLLPEDFKAGSITGLGGWPVETSGWFIRGTRRAAVVIVPAAGASLEQSIAYIRMLHEAGYATVALDSLSSAQLGTDWGWAEHRGALAAAQKLTQMGYKKIAALGISEGAAAAIFAQAERPVFKAIIADSPYASLSEMLHRNPAIAGLNPAFTNTVLSIARRWYGLPIERISPAMAAASLHNLPLLLIQNGGDQITPVADAGAIRKAAGSRAELWIAPSVGHGDAIYEARDAYALRVTDFLRQRLDN